MGIHACRRGWDWSLLGKYRYAHRGLHCIAEGIPENTLAAFERAPAHGYGAELDVHLTSDGQLLVIHDDNLQRLCGREGEICRLTADEIRACGILGTEHHAPLLKEVLPLFEDKTPLIVEIKTEHGNSAELTEKTCALLDEYRVNYCMESFDPFVLLWLRKHRPEICRGQLSCDFSGEKKPKSPVVRHALTNLWFNFLTRPDFIAYRYSDRSSKALHRCITRYGAREFGWTIRSMEDLQTLERDGGIPIFENIVP